MKFTQKGGIRMKRALVSGTVCCLLICVMLLANFAAYAFTIDKNTYIDLTTEGLYTLSDAMKEELDKVKTEVTITFCTDPDYLLNYHDTRYAYIMAKEIEKYNDNIKVETVNINKNPTAVQKYKTTSATKISSTDVIVSSGERFRIIGASAFWSYDSTGTKYWAFNGEYKMANAILSVSSQDEYTAYFTTGHGESVYDAENPDAEANEGNYQFYRLLRDSGLKVKTLDLDTQDIPEDCVLLIMNAPTEDYSSAEGGNMNVSYSSPMEKIDRYLDGFGSFMVFTDPTVELPELEEYLTEWGMQLHHETVKGALNVDMGDGAEASRVNLEASYADSTKNSLGYSLYSDVIDLAGTPKTIIRNSGYITRTWDSDEQYNSRSRTSMYSAVLLSSENSSAYNSEGHLTGRDGSYHLASVTARVHTKEVSPYYSYVFAACSPSLTKDEFLSNGTYANYDIMFAIVRTISRTDVYAADSLGALSMNTSNYGGKILQSDAMSETERQIYENKEVVRTYAAMNKREAISLSVVIFILPLVIIPALCIYVTTKRKYL